MSPAVPPRGFGGGDLSIVQVLYDSLAEIKQATDGIAKRQTEQGLLLERQSGQIANLTQNLVAYEAKHDLLNVKLSTLNDRVDRLTRIGWLAGILGSFVIVVATGVATESINRLFHDRDRTPSPSVTTNRVHDAGA